MGYFQTLIKGLVFVPYVIDLFPYFIKKFPLFSTKFQNLNASQNLAILYTEFEFVFLYS